MRFMFIDICKITSTKKERKRKKKTKKTLSSPARWPDELLQSETVLLNKLFQQGFILFTLLLIRYLAAFFNSRFQNPPPKNNDQFSPL